MTPADLDALVASLSKSCKVADSCPECALDRAEAAAELVQLREEISARSDLMQGYLDCWRKSEAAYERLQSSAIAGEKGLKVLQARIAELERERDPRP